MAKKANHPYNSPGHVKNHPAFNLPPVSGGDMSGQTLPGSPMPPGGQIGQPQEPMQGM